MHLRLHPYPPKVEGEGTADPRRPLLQARTRREHKGGVGQGLSRGVTRITKEIIRALLNDPGQLPDKIVRGDRVDVGVVGATIYDETAPMPINVSAVKERDT